MQPLDGPEATERPMTNDELNAALREHVDRKDIASLLRAIANEHPADIAGFIAELPRDDVWSVLDSLALDLQAKVFSYLPRQRQAEIVSTAPRNRLAEIVTEMSGDDRADLYNALSDAQRRALLPALAQAEREDLVRLAAYREGTAGAIMTSEYATIDAEATAAQAIEKLRNEAPGKETIYRAYLVDPDRRLIGSVRLQDLITAAADTRVEALMDVNTLAVGVDDHQEQVAERIRRYDVLALPVVDPDGRLVGIVTHDDAADVAHHEATEDIHKGGTVHGLVTNVRQAGVFVLYRARIVWLVLLVFGNIFSGAGIAAFEDTIASYVALVFFLPLLIDSGGNAGSQAATLMVRGLATGDVRMRDWGKMLGKEVLVAGLLGLSMAVAVSFLGFFRGGPEIAVVVSLSMILIVIIGSVIGMSLPFILSRLKLDPATASAPLVTSIADAAGVIVYFSLATTLLPLA
jgi:magnesium transporter